MTTKEKLEAAKAEVKRLNALRMALPDDAPDAELDAANKAYFAAIEAQAAAQREYTQSISTPAQLAAQAEQEDVQRRQLEARKRLAEKDARTPGIPKTQAQLDI